MTTTFAVLGASGDLTKRLLLPGLGSLLADTGRDVRVLGASSDDLDAGEWTARVIEALAAGGLDEQTAARMGQESEHRALDVTDAEAFPDYVRELPEDSVLYFALPPAVAMAACEVLSREDIPSGLKLVLEKPFGTDRVSAKQFNALLVGLVPEEQIFRSDHFLGDSTVLNLIGLRFANRLIEPAWSGRDIESLEIIWDETLALEGRAGYYDGTGALLDMIQSHLLMVMALATMEEPGVLDHRDVRDAMAKVLRATHLRGSGAEASRRARYTAGRIGDRDVPDYTAEPDVDASLDTETLAEVDLEIRDARWGGVPITLRSGKALGRDLGVVRATFKPVRHIPQGLGGAPAANRIELGLQPGGITVRINTNGADDVREIETTELTGRPAPGQYKPYGQVLATYLEGDPLFSVRGDMAEECWRIVEEVTAGWESGEVPLDEYPAGSLGPAAWPERV